MKTPSTKLQAPENNQAPSTKDAPRLPKLDAATARASAEAQRSSVRLVAAMRAYAKGWQRVACADLTEDEVPFRRGGIPPGALVKLNPRIFI